MTDLTHEQAITAIEMARLRQSFNQAFSQCLEKRGTPDVLLVCRGDIDTQNRNHILGEISGDSNMSYAPEGEIVFPVKSDQETLPALRRLAEIGGYNGLKITFHESVTGNFRFYCPPKGGLPLTTKHVFIIEPLAPTAA